jgi:tryptophanase
MKLPYAEPFRIKMVEEISQSTREQREIWLQEAHYNLFNLKSSQVFIDLLTDSGTGAMSDKQWGELMTGDESYAGSRSFEKLQKQVEKLTGFQFLLPVHQGRAAENVLFSTMIKENDIIPGNSHFDTTKGHIEFRKAHAVDCTIDEAFDIENLHPFKGNLENILAIELMFAAQGLEFRRPLKSSKIIEENYEIIRAKVKKLENDRLIGEDILTIAEMVKNRAFKVEV